MRSAAALVLPALLLVLIELALRLAGVGYPTAFLIPSASHGRNTWVQNNKFGWRFFGRRKSRTPGAISILREKPAGVIRIFVFGESAAFGDPQPAFGLPRVLQATLSLRHPDLKFEVVNAAMTAINSHVVLPIARDCAHAGGDIWVVYMGNNEVIGPFGAGTVFGKQAPPLPLVRATLALKATRLGQLLDSVRKPDQAEWGGMMMFLNNRVPASDPRLATVYRNYEGNLLDIIRAGRDCGAGVVVSTVAVNLKDCAPFASQQRADLSEADRQKCEELNRQGIEAQAAGNFSDAIARFRAAAQLDDTSAELQFRLGRCLLAKGDAAAARQALGAARDMDMLRFRCDSRLNELARKAVAGREADRVILADSEVAFAAASPDGVPGSNLFYEHVHLTFEGNCLLARTLAEQIEKLLPQGAGARPADWPTVADCARRLGRTDRDLKPALVEILSRLTEPPFTMQANHAEQLQLVTQELRQLGANADPSNTLRVAQSALREWPDDSQLNEQVAALELAEGDVTVADEKARRALDLLPSSSEYWSQLGQVFVHEKKYNDAAAAYKRAFDLNPQDVEPLQDLAMSLAKSGRNSDAMREFRRAVEITPGFGLAWLGLGQLLETEGRKDEAAECYRKGLQNRIHGAPELAALARFCMGHGWYEAAATNFDDAVRLDPSDPALSLEAGRAHFLFGSQLGKSGQSGPAAREFREAARLMPDMIEARLNLGIALYREGQWNDSRAEFEAVAARNPTNAVARHYLDLLRDHAAP